MPISISYIIVTTRYFLHWEDASLFPLELSYDPRYSIDYIRLREQNAEVQTMKGSDELNASDGALYGIELLNAKEQLSRDRSGFITIVNEATGKQAQVALPQGKF